MTETFLSQRQFAKMASISPATLQKLIANKEIRVDPATGKISSLEYQNIRFSFRERHKGLQNPLSQRRHIRKASLYKERTPPFRYTLPYRDGMREARVYQNLCPPSKRYGAQDFPSGRSSCISA